MSDVVISKTPPRRWLLTKVTVGRKAADVHVDRADGNRPARANFPFKIAKALGIKKDTKVTIDGEDHRVADVTNPGERNELLICVLLPWRDREKAEASGDDG